MNKINYDERKITYIVAIEKWGMAAQVDMVIEEMAELIKEYANRSAEQETRKASPTR